MGEQPLEYDGGQRFNNLKSTYPNGESPTRMYSRVSLAKIIHAKSTKDLTDQTTSLITATTEEKKLLVNGQTIFRGENRDYPSGNVSN